MRRVGLGRCHATQPRRRGSYIPLSEGSREKNIYDHPVSRGVPDQRVSVRQLLAFKVEHD